LPPKLEEDKGNGRQASRLRFADLREMPMLWIEKLEMFYRGAS